MIATRSLVAGVLVALCSASVAARQPDFPAATPESQGLSDAALAELGAAVEGYVEKGYAVGGELLVIKNRRVVFHEAYGWADQEDKRPWEIGAICNIRSMTKPLTGTAAQILIDRGDLGLDDTAAKYLPGFDNDRSRAITVRQLLTHRSGLPLTILTTIDQYPDLITMANAAGERGPEFPPDSKFWYSDTGTDVVGAIVEVVSGERLDAFIEREVIGPLGMTDTFYHYGEGADQPRAARIASLYIGAANAWTRFWSAGEKPFYPFAWGSQTVYSTPLDYAKFLAMWMDVGRAGGTPILSPEAIARVLTPVSSMSMLGSDQPFPTEFRGLDVRYGQMSVLYCPEGDPDAGPVILSHSGSDGTMAWAWPDLDLMVLYFTQSRGGTTVLRLEPSIDRLLIHPGEEIAEAEIPDALRPFVGVYIANFAAFENEEFSVLARDGKLVLDIPSQMAYELREPDAEGRWAFALAPDQIQVSFGLGADGAAELLRLHQAGMTFEVPRKGTALAEEQTKPIAIDRAILESLVGNYHDAEADRILEVFLDDGGALSLKAPPGIVLQLRPVRGKDLTWLVKQSPAVSLSFERDESGKIVSMTRHIGDETLVMTRQD